MSAVDMARNGRQFSAEDVDAASADSPPRPTMGPADHLGEQFADVISTSGGEPPADRHPYYIGGLSVHDWRAGSRDDHDTKGAS